MPESWEIKLEEFRKLLDSHEKAVKQGTSVKTAEAEASAQPEPAGRQTEPERPAAKPWPPPIPGLPKREPQIAQPAAPAPSPEPDPEAVVILAREQAAAAAPPVDRHETPTQHVPEQERPPTQQLDMSIPRVEDYLTFLDEPPAESSSEIAEASVQPEVATSEPKPETRRFSFSPTPVSQPTPQQRQPEQVAPAQERPPSHLQALARGLPRDAAQHYYTRKFKETREELLQRLLDPPLTLEETARILNVCPMTVRRYTNRGVLPHFRTAGNQRRFRLSDVLTFLEARSEAAASDTEHVAEGE